MEISLIAGQTNEIDFAPSTEYAEILQNIRTILATPVFSVPLDRDFGIDLTFLDKPMPVARAKAATELIQKIRQYEPRVEVTSVTWEAEEDGILKPKVQVKIVES